MNGLSNIAFEQIQGNYYWGQYGDFKVIIDITYGYINVTHLCGLAVNRNGSKKEFRVWKQNNNNIEFLQEVSASVDISTDELLIIPTDLPIHLRGTYAHPKLVPHIASWASPKFALKVSDIVNAYLVREYQDSIRVKDQTIDRLEAKVDEQIKQMTEQTQKMNEQTKQIELLLSESRAIREEANTARNENAVIIEQLDNITNELDIASIANVELTATTNTIAAKLNIATDQRVPPARSKCNEVFAIYRNPNTGQFYMVRRQKRTLQAGLNHCSRNGYTERFFYSDSPNAVNLGSRIRDVLPSNLAMVSVNVITLAQGKTPADLLDTITRAEREKKNI
jgi:hypothetical protein